MSKVIKYTSAIAAGKIPGTTKAIPNKRRTRITPKKIINGPLEWYDISEQTQYVLNSKLTSYMKLRGAEQRSENPNTEKIARLTTSIDEIVDITSHLHSFQSMKPMKSILEKYASDATGHIG